MVLMWTNLSSWHPPCKALEQCLSPVHKRGIRFGLGTKQHCREILGCPCSSCQANKTNHMPCHSPMVLIWGCVHPDGSHHLGVGPVALPGVEHEPSCGYWQGCTFQLLRQFHHLACSGDFSSTHLVPHFQKWQCRNPVCCPGVVCVWVRVETG